MWTNPRKCIDWHHSGIRCICCIIFSKVRRINRPPHNAQSLENSISVLQLNVSRLLFSARLLAKAENISLPPPLAISTHSSFKEHLWSRRTFENSTQASVLIDLLFLRSKVWSVLHIVPILFQPRSSFFSCTIPQWIFWIPSLPMKQFSHEISTKVLLGLSNKKKKECQASYEPSGIPSMLSFISVELCLNAFVNVNRVTAPRPPLWMSSVSRVQLELRR